MRLFVKSTSQPVVTGVYLVDVAAKPPGKTFAVYMAVDAEAPPTALLGAIEAMGYKRAVSSPYKHQDGKQVLDLHFHKAGTDIFEGWTVAEKEANLAKLGEVFGAAGVTITPRVMSLAEAF
jgi:hypothetical protein